MRARLLPETDISIWTVAGSVLVSNIVVLTPVFFIAYKQYRGSCKFAAIAVLMLSVDNTAN